jgi:hypothetical protein
VSFQSGCSLNRRAWLSATAAGLLGLVRAPLLARSAWGDPSLRMVVATDHSTPASEASGLAFGWHEAAHLATLLGRPLEVVDLARAGADTVTARPWVVVAAAGPERVLSLAARWSDAVVIATRRGNWVGTAQVLSVASHGGTVDRAVSADPPDEQAPVDWHHSLRRYGAAQLNERYRRHAGREMDGHAWRGWMACKVAAECLVRSDDAAVALHPLDMTFDGHKGRPLTFSREHRHLQQPVYVVPAGGGAPIEVHPNGSGA